MKVKEYADNVNKDNIGDVFSGLAWIYGYAKKHWISIVIYTVIGMSGALIGIFNSLVSRDLVDIITGHKTGELLKSFVLIIGIQLITVAINNASMFINSKITLKVENEIKADIYDQIMETEWEELSKFHSGNIVSRWSGDSTNIAMGILNTLPNAFVYLFRFGSALYMVVKYDWTFAAIALCSVPISYVVSRTNLKRMQKANMGSLAFSAKMSSFTQESFSNVQNVKALDMVGLYRRRLRELQKEQADIKISFQKISILNSIILTLVTTAITYSTYGWGIYKVWSGAITYGTMTMFLTLSQSLSGTTQNLINLVPSTINVLNASRRIRDILELKKEDYSQMDEAAVFAEEHREQGIGVEIQDVAFAYLSGTKVFEQASFCAYPREIVGLVGPSGEGKTTMLRMLLAIISPAEGSGRIVAGEGAKASDYMELSASTRQLFAYVPQGNSMFPGTIAENMRNVKEDASDEEIEEALKMACAWEFVSKLPEGINTEIKERGGGFSEGQAQRLSIARALLRKSPILLLDEATSALDIDTADRVMNNIMNDTYPRTCIITTHRTEVMKICHRMYKVDELKVVDQEIGGN